MRSSELWARLGIMLVGVVAVACVVAVARVVVQRSSQVRIEVISYPSGQAITVNGELTGHLTPSQVEVDGRQEQLRLGVRDERGVAYECRVGCFGSSLKASGYILAGTTSGLDGSGWLHLWWKENSNTMATILPRASTSVISFTRMQRGSAELLKVNGEAVREGALVSDGAVFGMMAVPSGNFSVQCDSWAVQGVIPEGVLLEMVEWDRGYSGGWVVRLEDQFQDASLSVDDRPGIALEANGVSCRGVTLPRFADTGFVLKGWVESGTSVAMCWLASVC